jgi:nucleoside 2-deoxyribosyltransferase
MKRVETVFLAGPDIWYPNAAEHLRRRKALCVEAGLTAISPPLGEAAEERQDTEIAARLIYADALSALRGADALIANFSPWRGVHCDPTAAFLAGFAAALQKPVMGYMNIVDEDDGDARGRIEAMFGASSDVDGRWRDDQDCVIEDLGLPETLMLWAEARRFFVIVTPDPINELTGLEMCLQALQIYAE